MQHSLKLIRYLTGNQCKDLRRGVIFDEREVRTCNNASNRVFYCLQAMKRILWQTI